MLDTACVAGSVLVVVLGAVLFRKSKIGRKLPISILESGARLKDSFLQGYSEVLESREVSQ